MSTSAPTHPIPAAELLLAEAGWHTIDCISDLHLQQDGATWQTLRHYLRQTPAQALFLLGDIFEVWVGDDVLDDAGHAFEQQVADELATLAARGCQVLLMHGNRDFLLAQAFCERARARMLPDPSVLQLPDGERVLLSHGDALCIDDVAYMQFRQTVRNPAVQQQFLQQPLAARVAMTQQMRAQSDARKNALGVEGYADVDAELARAWLLAHDATTLIHGHTHRPGEHALQQPQDRCALRRIVLSDWELEPGHGPQRAQVLRWQAGSPDWQRLSPTAAAV